MVDNVKLIRQSDAVQLINQYHYSKVLPRINKYFIGGFYQGNLVAVCTLGYGVRPKHTIKKIFPSLNVNDYFEIGKLCVADEMPKNTESHFIAQCIHLIKENFPEKKILFSWADGIVGKPGYVYQCSNFFYGGFIWTEMYLDRNGIRIHARTFQGLSDGERVGKFKSRSYEVAKKQGLTKYFGKQFRYVYPLCDKREWKKLLKESSYEWLRCNYPKDIDCEWKVQTDKNKREECPKPDFKMTKYTKNEEKNELLSILQF